MTSTLCIIGLGLIGGSLAKAIKQHGASHYRVMGYHRRQEVVDQALAENAIDRGSTDLSDALSQADIIILATPLSTYPYLLDAINRHASREAIISDVGSVKGQVCTWMHEHLSSERHPFCLPAHPIAGSHLSGLDAADGDLYRDKKLILTPLDATCDATRITMETLWQHCGAQIEALPATRHDAIYARVSHLPQWLSFHLKEFLLQNPALFGDFSSFFSESSLSHNCSGANPVNQLPSPLREIITQALRLTHSPTEIWDEIFTYNHHAHHEALTAYLYFLKEQAAHHFSAAVESKELQAQNKKLMASDIIQEILNSISSKLPPLTQDDLLLLTQQQIHLLQLLIEHSRALWSLGEHRYGGSGLKSCLTPLILPNFMENAAELSLFLAENAAENLAESPLVEWKSYVLTQDLSLKSI